MNITIVIVAHTQRQKIANKLAKTVNADHVCWDDGGLGVNGNHRAAWNWHLTHPADWSIVLEDDAIPCSNFRKQLSYMLPHSPAPIVSLYLGKQRPPHWQETVEWAVNRAAKADACFIVGQHNLHAVAIAGSQTVVRIINMALSLYGIYPADEALSTWCARNSIDIAYSQPSLVDHNDQLPTLIKHRDGNDRPPGRVAWRHGTRHYWTNKAVPLIAPLPLKASND